MGNGFHFVAGKVAVAPNLDATSIATRYKAKKQWPTSTTSPALQVLFPTARRLRTLQGCRRSPWPGFDKGFSFGLRRQKPQEKCFHQMPETSNHTKS